MDKLINTGLIFNYLKDKNLTKTAFCKLCKVSPSTLNKILNNDPHFRIKALFKIARQLQLKIHQLFRF